MDTLNIEKYKFLLKSFILAFYLFVNSLFLIKYIENYGFYVSIVFIVLHLYFYKKYNKFCLSENFYRLFFISILIIFFTFTIYINYKIDGNSLNVDRWSALEFGIKALLNNQYPYDFLSHMQHKSSNLPGLLFITMPFYILFGSVGYFQSFIFLVISYLIYKVFNNYKERFFCLVLFVSSPSYLWEIYTKSDFMSNFVLALVFIYWVKIKFTDNNFFKIILLSIFSVFLLLTRLSIVLPMVLVMLPILYKFDFKNKVLFFLVSVLIFGLLNFIVFHNAESVEKVLLKNPYLVQSSRQPILITVSFLVFSFIISFRIKSFLEIISVSGVTLFVMILTLFFIILITFGFNNLLFNSYFDLSYFNMSMPFIILALSLFTFEKKIN